MKPLLRKVKPFEIEIKIKNGGIYTQQDVDEINLFFDGLKQLSKLRVINNEIIVSVEKLEVDTSWAQGEGITLDDTKNKFDAWLLNLAKKEMIKIKVKG